jgi:hypothetical protein
VSEPLAPSQIAKQINMTEGAVNTTLHRMMKDDGVVVKVGYGKYIAASRPSLKPKP